MLTYNNLMKFMAYFAGISVLLLISDVALAEGETGLTGVATRVTGAMESVKSLIVAAAYVAGVGFFLSGLIKFKAHRDNPNQVPLSAPIVLICVGAGLVFLPSIIKTAGETAFESAEAGGTSGTGF